MTNTEYERLALEGRINLSDGHARQELVPAERSVVETLPDIWHRSHGASQTDVEEAFSSSFFGLAGQHSRLSDQSNRYFSYSASCSILIAAQMARARNQLVYLLEPTFDNIYHILRSQGVEVLPIQESEVQSEWLQENFIPGSMLWLTLPNNPTGFTLRQERFQRVASCLSQLNGSITLDFAYRFFCADMYLWDQYEELEDSGIPYICLEDTGKTWATADFKFGVLTCADSYNPLAHRFHDELLLNVSPVALELVRQFIEVTASAGGYEFISERLAEPREIVHAALPGTGLLHKATECTNVPMELLGLPSGSSVHFWASLRNQGIELLPAHNYFWSVRKPPSDLFRIPLTRPPGELREAMQVIKHVEEQTFVRRQRDGKKCPDQR
ncbi:aminotransferase class I/II-fold pyridoxal phosphate-dependent enzyme [uncultured Serinicoccus sp.]|uniref:aminotransferase class I/II-fold pyridoxal phosphate-dependent enzyme n=1 Tax=uncultured Serinicoccus sp. TaxID=735514 RepID=UPI002635AC58|nr:aminotransferase class I/II-fold pyridoxal phosphate-dependent enzyme [uncultured Serinicoccus sp.]